MQSDESSISYRKQTWAKGKRPKNVLVDIMEET